MIEFRPEISGNTVIYLSYEDSECTGKVILTLDSLTHSTLHSVTAVNEETAEGLIRSALTAAANRSVFSVNYSASDFIDIAVCLGFKERKGVLYGEIPFLLSGCCGCSCDK
ncbi:MAG: hypothetical protein IJA87_05870 [Clostridia bacterium]|nr:hypothetical protein [Clostridia bacterium]